jgi:hypothetical protein
MNRLWSVHGLEPGDVVNITPLAVAANGTLVERDHRRRRPGAARPAGAGPGRPRGTPAMKGMIAWFARNDGRREPAHGHAARPGAWALTMPRSRWRCSPPSNCDIIVVVRVPFRGATPTEVEEGITVKIEEAVQDLDGIKTLRSTAVEKRSARCDRGRQSRVDPRELMNDVKARVDAISTFPVDSERPVVIRAGRASAT